MKIEVLQIDMFLWNSHVKVRGKITKGRRVIILEFMHFARRKGVCFIGEPQIIKAWYMRCVYFSIKMSIKEKYSKRELIRQIDSSLFEIVVISDAKKALVRNNKVDIIPNW